MQLGLQICSMVLLLSLIYFHYCHSHITTPVNITFGRMLVYLSLLIFCNFTNYVLHVVSFVPPGLFGMLSMLSNVFLILFLCHTFNYVCDSMGVTEYKIGYLTSYLFVFVIIVLSYRHSFVIPLYNVAIVSIFCVSISFLRISAVNRHDISLSKFNCLLLWLVLWISATLVEYLFGVDFSSFACAMGLFFLFYSSENPEGKIDKTSGFFMAYFIQDYFLSKSTEDLSIAILHSRNSTIDFQTIKNLVHKRKIACFMDTNNFCYLVGTNTDELNNILLEYNKVYTSVLMLAKHVKVDTVSNILNYSKRQIDRIGESFVYSIHLSHIQKLDKDDKMHLEIINALVENRIVTYVQPIYDLATDTFISGECLCRLVRRNGELVPPNEFISVAERTGLIVDIETSMFRNMCKCLADERIQQSSIKYLEANLSIKKGEQRDLFEEYATIVKEYGVAPDRVNLEITETDSVDKKMSILNNMQVMRELGFHFSLDDFGTGESNLGYIIDMPVSVIKFDRDITQKAMVDDKALTIVRNVIKMVHDLNINVVVEGVETKEDLDMCRSLNADYIQGYYFSKPLPMDEFIDFVIEADATGKFRKIS